MNAGRPAQVVAAFQRFFDGQQATNGDPGRHAVELFHRVVTSVPAYRDFLQTRGVDPASVRTFADFQALPLLTKENYHRRYQLDVAVRFDHVFSNSFKATERRTLAVVCFPLGTWVGGLYTASCVRHLAAKGYPITVIAPSNNKAEILRVVPELGRHVDQVVLLGYPPFIKDVIDAGLAAGVDWQHYAIKLVLAGEVFSEEWRELVGRRAGMTDPINDSAALYGTADAGVLGNETPLSVRIRRFLAGNPAAARELFGESRIPTLVQYDPMHRFFETNDGTLLFSGDNGVPLIRYHIADEGGLRTAWLRSHAGGGKCPSAAVRVRVRQIAVHGLLLRREHLPGECRRGAGTTAHQ
jgi:phenylacetate-CoA ligase